MKHGQFCSDTGLGCRGRRSIGSPPFRSREAHLGEGFDQRCQEGAVRAVGGHVDWKVSAQHLCMTMRTKLTRVNATNRQNCGRQTYCIQHLEGLAIQSSEHLDSLWC